MKREIKFRAWRKARRQWLTTDEMPIINGNISTVLDITNDEIEFIQFTGLKDKNGKEIYEGDIIKTESDKVMVITWSERYASFCIERDGWAFKHWFGEAFDADKCEVIGNIYENPELLKS